MTAKVGSFNTNEFAFLVVLFANLANLLYFILTGNKRRRVISS